MWRLLGLGLASAALSLALSDQNVLRVEEASAGPWRLNYSSTAPYLFSSVSSLLQQWSNTIFPNGHSLVPCDIPAYTLFYHGRLDGEQPPSPEWLAFDM